MARGCPAAVKVLESGMGVAGDRKRHMPGAVAWDVCALWKEGVCVCVCVTEEHLPQSV